MRNLFIVGSKLLGLLCLYWTFGEIAQIGVALTQLPSLQSMGTHPVWYIFSIACYMLIHLLFGLVLIIRADWLADVVRVPDTSAATGAVTPAVLLYTLLIALSVFVMLMAIPKMASGLFHWIEANQYGRPLAPYEIGELLGSGTQLLLAFIVIARMKAMARTLLPPLNDAVARTAEAREEE